MPDNISFDDSKAKTYRKRVEVLAFQSSDPFQFSKTWGEQKVRKDGWVIISLTQEGEVTQDIYGCDRQVFQDTYEPSSSSHKNQYHKKETIRAYQPGDLFKIDTVLQDGYKEVEGADSKKYDNWKVKAYNGEVYFIEDKEFKRTYVEVTP